MNKELFGVFGDESDFERFRSTHGFDAVVRGDRATVGVRDVGLGIPGRSSCHEADDGVCAIWGEAYVPEASGIDTAQWLLEQYAETGRRALSALNGSYVVYVEHDDEALVATDQLRSWECFYGDTPHGRVFGTDSEAVARAAEASRVHRRPLLEFLYLGIVLGEKTLFDAVSRVPFDGYLTPDDVGDLERFVYAPTEFAYVDELADRLERALRRRRSHPGTKAMLLSAGYDSRLVLAGIPDIERCYTLGDAASREVTVASRIADQYDSEHVTLAPDERYLRPDEEKTQYSQGLRESVHIHHAGYDDRIEADTVYHGLMSDTFLSGHFLPRRTVDALGTRVTFERLDPDPDPVETLLDRFGYDPAASRRVAEVTGLAEQSPATFVRRAVREEYEKGRDRAESTYNAIDLCGLRNQPVAPFRHHLADNYLESFVAADAGLLDWHLRAPPEQRCQRTFLRACREFDPEIHRHRPPGRPSDSCVLNQATRFARRWLPFVQRTDPPWPDKRRLYDRYGMDESLFPTEAHYHDLPVREKFRLNDVRSWVERCTDEPINPTQVVRQPA